MIREIHQQGVQPRRSEHPDQAGDNEIVVQHGVVVIIGNRHLLAGQRFGKTFPAVEACVGRWVSVLVFCMGAEQMYDDELARFRIAQDLLEWFKNDFVILARVLRTTEIQVVLLVRLPGKSRQHGVALGHGLLIGDPVRLVAGLFHDVHQRWPGQVQIRVFLVGEGQHLLQDFDGEGARCIHLLEDQQLIAHAVQLWCGRARIPVKAHVLPVGRFTEDQHQRRR